MPIYAYRCTKCGFKKDVLQKMSDAQLTLCPDCKTENFTKQVTAAGFQLKGSGWYATDFKGGGQPSAEAKTETKETKSDTLTPASAASTTSTPVTPVKTATESPST